MNIKLGTTNAAVFVLFDQKTAQVCWAGPPGFVRN